MPQEQSTPENTRVEKADDAARKRDPHGIGPPHAAGPSDPGRPADQRPAGDRSDGYKAGPPQTLTIRPLSQLGWSASASSSSNVLRPCDMFGMITSTRSKNCVFRRSRPVICPADLPRNTAPRIFRYDQLGEVFWVPPGPRRPAQDGADAPTRERTSAAPSASRPRARAAAHRIAGRSRCVVRPAASAQRRAAPGSDLDAPRPRPSPLARRSLRGGAPRTGAPCKPSSPLPL